MKTAWALLTAFWAWMLLSMPDEMGVIGKATGHMFAQVIEIGWGVFLVVNFLLIVGWLGMVFTKGTK